MCGIAGIYRYDLNQEFPDENKISLSLHNLNKRGPDFYDIYRTKEIILLHARLAIIDKSEEANQPMTDSLGRYTIIYNGEIYNYKALRSELINKGIEFNTSSDTEVVLKSYIHWGVDCLQKFNGFFAFAIFDKETREVFLARDHVGIKPLYYAESKSKFIFGSELKALTPLLENRKINQAGLINYFAYTYIPSPYTIYANVHKLLPGHYIIIKNGKSVIKQYYDLNAPLKSQESVDYKDLKKIIEQSVEDRLIADVPVGAFLSGGLDSTIITGIASKLHKGINSFSIGFKDEPFFDESKHAERISSFYGTHHHTFRLSNDDLFEELDNFLDYIDEPFADSSALAVYILSKNTRKHVKVALSGDGADELFAGYNKYKGLQTVESLHSFSGLIKLSSAMLEKLPSSRNSVFSNKVRQLKKAALLAGLNDAEKYDFLTQFIHEGELRSLLSNYDDTKSFLLDHKTTPVSNLNEVLLNDIQLVLQNDMLVKVDRNSMGNSLEVRVPFLDPRVVQYAISLPEQYKIHEGHGKWILRKAFLNEVPEAVLARKKHGFDVPLLKWFRNELNSRLTELLDRDFIEDQGIFNYQYIVILLKRLNSKNPGDVHILLWELLVFQTWYKKWYLN